MSNRRSRRRNSSTGMSGEIPARSRQYRQLRHPFKPQAVLSEDAVATIHNKALAVLEELGIRILLPEARSLLANAGAVVDENEQMAFVGRDIIEHALESAPRSFHLRAASPEREQIFEQGTLLFSGAGGCPNVTDLNRGRRAGSLSDFDAAIKLQQSFDVIHTLSPSAEPQDIPPNLRHYDIIRSQLRYSDKPLFAFARGHGQVQETFEIVKLGMNLGDSEFENDVWVSTVINTNSPRQLDVPMAQGIIDFARAGQLSIITPFCLAGAMAPITIAGALVLQHAEALAGIALAQISKAGSPVAYGGFASNVDMKSGSPAFGTPEHVKLSIGTGQLARHIGLPWRSAAGSASKSADMQSATENNMGLWGALQANATLVLHSAGWLEGGLTFGYEKFINDIEALQTMAELCLPVPVDEDALGYPAIAEVQPGGHFFATQQTMDRYKQAFYEPLVSDLDNHGTWLEKGGMNSTERATSVWQAILEDFKPPEHSGDTEERIAAYMESGIGRGGQPLA